LGDGAQDVEGVVRLAVLRRRAGIRHSEGCRLLRVAIRIGWRLIVEM
jgi:hypothetical protein